MMSKKRKIFSEDQLYKPEFPPPAVINMIGKTYGRLTVLKFSGYSILDNGKFGSAYIMCKCGCGKVVLGAYPHIKGGKWVSCGCLKEEHPPRFKHGFSTKKDKLYSTWKGIRKRCYCKSDEAYDRYGGSGIVMCDGWGNDKTGFINFKNDMGEPISPKFSIDRIDFNGNYSCGHCEECIENKWQSNCRWADIYTQARNKSSNKYVMLNNNKLTYAEAERELGFSHGTIKNRLLMGWDIEKIISTPILYSQRTRMNLSRKIIDWSFDNGDTNDIEAFISLWTKLNPQPIYKISKKQELYNKHLNLL